MGVGGEIKQKRYTENGSFFKIYIFNFKKEMERRQKSFCNSSINFRFKLRHSLREIIVKYGVCYSFIWHM